MKPLLIRCPGPSRILICRLERGLGRAAGAHACASPSSEFSSGKLCT